MNPHLRFHNKAIVLVIVLLCSMEAMAQASPPAATAVADRFAALDTILQNAVDKGLMPGAVCIVGHNGLIVYRKAFGNRSVGSPPERMTVDTVFDMASLTKVMATTGSIMRMVQMGQIKLNDPVARYIPEFAQNGKEEVTVRQLLTHYSGLRADLDLRPPINSLEEGYRRANAEKLINPPGSTFLYSDINFIVLGELVNRVSGLPLEIYSGTFIFGPLGMTNTRFLPPLAWMPRTAPTMTDPKTGEVVRAVVHDPTARQMGGVAGHAGLFSTADDTAKFAQAMLNGGAPVWSRGIVEKMTTPQQPPNMTVVRGLGWDIDSPYSSNRGELLPVGSFGHTGFTGTSLWIDPLTKTYIVLLTNAVQMKEGSVIALRTEVATAVVSALNLNATQEQSYRFARITGYNEAAAASRRITERNGKVQAGIDELESNDFAPLRIAGVGRPRVGLLTNQTGIDELGHRTIDVLMRAQGVHLEAIFTPEYGLQGTSEASDANAKDASGVIVYNVFGDSDAKRRPPADVLRNLDEIVVDLQDTGTRFSSDVATLGYFLEAAAKAGKPVIVLDRPNLLNGAYVQGPVSETGRESYLSYQSLPLRHGMTIGELAKLLNSEHNINAKLTVVPLKGWMRGDWFDSTGAMWVSPSPYLRNLDEAILYPGVGLLELTNVSVGKGTDGPYQMIGAPWIRAVELAAALNARKIEGVRFVPVQFTPASGTLAHQQCSGVQILVINRETVDSAELGLELVAALKKFYPQQFEMEKVADVLANQAAFRALQAGEDPRRIADDWRDRLDRFMAIRAKYLIY